MGDRLYRSTTDRMISGVAGGLAERMDVDPSLVRIGWVLLAIFSGGIFALVYVVMAVVVPERPVGVVAHHDPGSGQAGPSQPAAAPAAGQWIGPDGQPVAAADPAALPTRPQRPGSGAIVAGGILILVGLWVLVARYLPSIDSGTIWPVIAIVLGVGLVGLAFIRPSHR